MYTENCSVHTRQPRRTFENEGRSAASPRVCAGNTVDRLVRPATVHPRVCGAMSIPLAPAHGWAASSCASTGILAVRPRFLCLCKWRVRLGEPSAPGPIRSLLRWCLTGLAAGNLVSAVACWTGSGLPAESLPRRGFGRRRGLIAQLNPCQEIKLPSHRSDLHCECVDPRVQPVDPGVHAGDDPAGGTEERKHYRQCDTDDPDPGARGDGDLRAAVRAVPFFQRIPLISSPRVRGGAFRRRDRVLEAGFIPARAG